MESFDWNPEKNDRLKRTRSIDFEDVVFHIQNGDLLAILEHPNPKRYPNQRVMVLDINGYAHLVPFVEQDGTWFLKTIIPSRKATREYLE